MKWQLVVLSVATGVFHHDNAAAFDIIPEARQCLVVTGDLPLIEAAAKCIRGDIIVVIIDERLGSPVGYAARVCDFAKEIAIYRHPHPDTSQSVVGCVYTGRVLEIR